MILPGVLRIGFIKKSPNAFLTLSLKPNTWRKVWFAGSYEGHEGVLFDYPCEEDEVRARN